MRRLLVFAACLSLVWGLASTASGQAAKKADKPAEKSMGAMPMKPAPEMDKIKWMVGTWHCTGKAMASPMAPEHPLEVEVKVDMALGGMWLRAEYREKKTAQNPNPISADDYWGYDPAEKMWDRVAVDNTGSFMTGTSKGWEQGKLVWAMEGMMGGQKMKMRENFVQKSPTELSYTGEMGSPDGKWTPAWEGSCKK